MDCLKKTLYESVMKKPRAPIFPQTSETGPSMMELLEAALAENKRLTKLVDKLRQEIVALREENLSLKKRIAMK